MDQSWATPRYDDYEEDRSFYAGMKVVAAAMLAVGGLCLALSVTVLLGVGA